MILLELLSDEGSIPSASTNLIEECNATMRLRLSLAVIVAGVLGAHASGASALTFTRHPWLNIQTTTSILIAWQTDLVASSRVLYSPEPVDWDNASEATQSGDVLNHAVSLTGLSPGTTYRYKVVSNADTLDAGTFRTAPDADGPYRFLAFGDLGRATNAQKLIAALVDSLNADFAILTGDIIYESGEAQNFTPYYFDIYRETLQHIPFYPCLGNHDNNPPSYGIPYVNTYYLPTNYPTAPERSYSFDYGNAHFVSIEVTIENNAPDAAMTSWLDADLAASTKQWKFVFFHVPMYSNLGAHGDDPTIAAGLEPILQARGVDMVFQGHNHYYTRTYPVAAGAAVDQGQDPNYLNPTGPIYIVAGGGGRALYDLTPLSSPEVISEKAFHVASIDVDGDLLTLRAVGMDGTVFDTMTLRKSTPTAIEVAAFTAAADPEGVRLRWQAAGTASSPVFFNVYRAPAGSEDGARLNAAPLSGGPHFNYLDRTATAGTTYRYRLGLIESGVERITGWIEGTAGRPFRFSLGPPRPNPSGGATQITFTLSRSSATMVRIVDVSGRAVRTMNLGTMPPGQHRIYWDGRDDRGRAVSSRRYFVVLRAEEDEARTPLTLVR